VTAHVEEQIGEVDSGARALGHCARPYRRPVKIVNQSAYIRQSFGTYLV